jgi:hypothetical protein
MTFKKTLSFRHFIFESTDEFLKEKVGEIYNELQTIQKSIKALGVDTLTTDIKAVISKIRGIVTGHWLQAQMPYLRILQKHGVSLSKGVHENDNIEAKIDSAIEEINNKIMIIIKAPVNQLGVEPKQSPAKAPEVAQQPPTEPDITAKVSASGFDMSSTPALGQPPEGALTI